jgi:hypothetical protein
VVTPGELDRLLMATPIDVPPLGDLMHRLTGPHSDELARCAAGPFAHLACRSLVCELSGRRPVPDSWVATIVAGLARQTGLLALLDSTDELLASPEFVRSYGPRLHATFLRAHASALGTSPLVAAAFIEGALRLAIAGFGNVLRTLAILTPVDVAAFDLDYVERLPRLLGAALDVWATDRSSGPALRETLSALQDIPDAAADATFERGLDLLRQVADGVPGEATSLLLAARRHFANTEAADEARHDAALYGAGIDAVMAFQRGSADEMRVAHAVLGARLDQRAAWLQRTHIPAWRRPRDEAAYAWARLVVILDRAQQSIAPQAWLDAWRALDAILDAYVLDRSVIPVPGALGQDGLALLFRPVIESSLTRRHTLLTQLRQAVDEAEHAAEPPARIDQLRRLRDRLDQLTVPADRPADHSPGPDVRLRERLGSVAPTLLVELGATGAATVARQLDDDTLRLVEGIAYNAAIAQASTRDPVTARLLERLARQLSNCADYTGGIRHAFDALVAETVMFLATRHDLQRSATVDYLKPTSPPPREAHLQNDFADWLRRGQLAGRVDVEVPNVATGRADVKLGFGTTRFFVEVKRELRDASNHGLERSYLTQAADYSGTSATLGILLVLDLTSHPTGVRHLSECAWVTRTRPANSSVDRYVVVAVVIGNRATPSSYSRAAK